MSAYGEWGRRPSEEAVSVPTERQNNALQMIFSFFLGLMVVAVVGVAVNTFYESPGQKYQYELQQLYRQQENLNIKGDGTLTAEERAQYESITRKIDELNRKQQEETEAWARTTSIILIACATLVMIVSLVRSEQLRVISNGLLLGGIGTMIYGTGWGVYSGSSLVRFFVVLFAFIVSVGLGYAKFVRGRQARAAEQSAASSNAVSAGVDPYLADRVQALERRLDAVASALLGEPAERRGPSV